MTIDSLIRQLEHMKSFYGGDLPIFLERLDDPDYPIKLEEGYFAIVDFVVNGIGHDQGFDPNNQKPTAVVLSPVYPD